MTNYAYSRAENLSLVEAAEAFPLKCPAGLILSTTTVGFYDSPETKTFFVEYPGLPVGAPHRISGIIVYFQISATGSNNNLRTRFRWKDTDYDAGDSFSYTTAPWCYHAEWFPVAPWSLRPWKITDLYDLEVGLTNAGSDVFTVGTIALHVVVEPTPFRSLRFDALGFYDMWDRKPTSGTGAAGFVDLDLSALVDNDQFTLSDGFNELTFTYQQSFDTVMVGDIVIDYSTATTDNEIALRTAQAINNSASWPTHTSNLVATVNGERVIITNLHPGQHGNVTMVATAAAAGIIVGGMSGGTSATSQKYSHVRLDEGQRAYLYPKCASLPSSYLLTESPFMDKLTYASEKKVNAADLVAAAAFSMSCAVNGSEAVFGAPLQDVGPLGAAYLFLKKPDGTWSEMQKLVMAPTVVSCSFGYAVAIAGDLIVVGAPQDGSLFATGGSVHVFERDDNLVTYTLTQTILPSDHAANCQFGHSVAINKCNEILVGACGSAVYGVYSFLKVGGTWTQQQKMGASDTIAADQFGWSLSAHEDSFIVGANLKDAVGAAYVFVKTAGVWAEQDKLIGDSDSATFGDAVSIQSNGCIVGDATDAGVSVNGGAAYLFGRIGTEWEQTDKVRPYETVTVNWFFGNSVSMGGPNYVYVGAYGRLASQGAVYCFSRAPGENDWGLTKIVAASDTANNDYFGQALASDGETLAVGAPAEDEVAATAGSAYLYEDDGYAWGSDCTFLQTLRLEETDYELPYNLDIDKIQFEVRLKGNGSFTPLLRDENVDTLGEPTSVTASWQTFRFPYYYRPSFTSEPSPWDLIRVRAAEFGLVNVSSENHWGHGRIDIFASLHTIDNFYVVPTGIGTWNHWSTASPNGGEQHYQDVNTNDNSTYLAATITDRQAFQSFAVSNSYSGQIYGARWMGRFRTRSTAKVVPLIIKSSEVYMGHPTYLNAWQWTEVAYDMWLNPVTGTPWASTDLQSMEVGMVLLEGDAECSRIVLEASLVPPVVSSSEDATWKASFTTTANEVLARCVADNTIYKIDKFSVGRGGFQYDNPGVVLPVDANLTHLAEEVWSGEITQADSLAFTAYYWCVIPPDTVGDPIGELMLWARIISSDNPKDKVGHYIPWACTHFPADFHTRKKLNVLRIALAYNV